MSENNGKEIRDFAYYLSRTGKFSVSRLVPSYCSEREFFELFSKGELRLLKTSSSRNRITLGLRDLEMKVTLGMVKYYPSSAFSEDVKKVFRNNTYDIDGNKVPAEARLSHGYLCKKCLEIADMYCKSEIEKLDDENRKKRQEIELMCSFLKTEMNDARNSKEV